MYTTYQWRALTDARAARMGGENFYIIAPSGVIDRKYLPQGDKLYEFFSKDRKTTFKDARALIAEIKKMVNGFPKNQFRFWLASDDHPVAQIIFCSLDVQKIMLIEDGLGSYIKHSFMGWDRGARSMLGKFKNWLFYAPYYKSFRACGSVRADEYFAYSEKAFPSAKRRVSLITRSRNKNDCQIRFAEGTKVLLVLGQPLSFDLGLSVSEYFQNIREAVYEVLPNGRAKGEWQVIYKTHPRKDYPLQMIFSELGTLPAFDVLECEASAEDIVALSLGGAHIKVVSFISTALFNMSIEFGDVGVFFIDSPSLNVPKEYYESLVRVGAKRVIVS